MKALAQKLSDPASLVNVQHKVLPAPAFVQSLALVQIWTCSVPEHVSPERCVGHVEAGLHAAVSVPVVQLGTEPPVMGMVAQQA